MGMNEKVLKLKYALMNVGVTCDNNLDAVLTAATDYIDGVVALPIAVNEGTHSSGAQFDEPEMPVSHPPVAPVKPKRTTKKK